MTNLDRNLYNLILWEELVVSFINNIQRGREPVYLADHIDYQWGGVRRLEVIKADWGNLTKIIKACNEIRSYNVRIELLRDEVRKRQSRRDVFEKTRYEGMLCFDYQGFSNELYQNVRFESHIELKITYQVLKFLPSLEPIRKILYVEAVIDMLENFCQLNYINELIDKNRIKFVLFTNILPSETMLCYFNSTNVEHRSYDNLKKFFT